MPQVIPGSLTVTFSASVWDASTTVLILSQTMNFRLFQTERVCIQQFQIDENGRKFSKWVKDVVGKGEIAHYEQQCFHKTYTADT